MNGSRIVLVTTATDRGGVWRHMIDLASGFTGRGHEVTIAVPACASVLIADATARGLPVTTVRASLRMPCDVWHLHLHKTFDTTAFGLLPARRAARGPVVVMTEHLPHVAAADPSMEWDPTLRPGVRKPGARHAKTLMKKAEVACAHTVIAVSEGSRDFLLTRYGVPHARVHHVPNGVEVIPREPPVPAAARMTVVAVGALGWRKGFDVLVDAAGRAREPWDAVVIGDGLLRDALERSAAAMAGGPATVRFAGYRPDAADATVAGHVACMPSRTESSPYAALEAMMRARPLVATRVEGLSELVVDGGTGSLVAPDDPAALAAALDHLAREPDLRERMGQAAYSRAVTRHSISAMLTGTLDVYAAARGGDR